MRILILGASGVVGKLLCAIVKSWDQHVYTWGLAGRSVAAMEQVAGSFPIRPAVLSCHVEQPESIRQVLREFQPDLLIHVAGTYTSVGTSLVEVCLQERVMQIDICDEPTTMQALRGLHDRAVEAGVPIIVGAGTAPQTSCALLEKVLEKVLEKSGAGVAVRFGYVLGMNNYGPRAVQTVSRGISGLMSDDKIDTLWKQGPVLHFPPPFGPLRIRRYPVPESLVLHDYPEITSAYTGARLSWSTLNAYFHLLQKLRMSPWGLARFWNVPVAAMCRMGYALKLGAPGIAVAIEAEKDGRIVLGQLYHPEMSQLTAHALALMIQHIERQRPAPGVRWGHQVLPADELLHALQPLGTVWSVSELSQK